jgi:type II secretory pathway pseudopilin PulG
MSESPDKPKSTKYLRCANLGVLVLILIMALLPNSPGHLEGAKRASVTNHANQIFSACTAYHAEYGELPSTSENYRLVKILVGDNPRKIEFLSLKPSDLTPNGDMIDSWGTPFRIGFDSASKVHVVSVGPDKIFGTPDDITNQ